MSEPNSFNIFARDFNRAESYTTYARMRAEDPIHLLEVSGEGKVWLVTRYEDVVAILKDERFIKDWHQLVPPDQLPEETVIDRLLNRHMLSMDPPDHTRLRALVQKTFTPRLMEQMRGRVQTIADELLDAVQDKGEMDLIDDYAFPLPIVVIAQMLGVPTADRDRFRKWSNIIVSPAFSAEEWEQASGSLLEFIQYMREMFDDRRANPRDDLISALVQAEEAGDKLSEEELFSMVMLLLVAGHETTVNLIGNGTLALLRHPDQFERLKNDPSLIKPAVEELLRYDGPVETSTERWASEDVEIGGKLIRRGEMIMVVIAAADHDPEVFENPEALDITRQDNRHVAFGQGIHYCLGAPLARIEGQIAINTLLRRMPNLKLKIAPEALAWRRGMLLRGLHELPVTF